MTTSPLLAELIPRRTTTYVFMLVGGVSVILVLGSLYFVGLRLAHLTTDGKLAVFDLDSEGSIASWYSIVLLFLCGLATLLVRRLSSAAGSSRIESRVWLAVALLWFIMSLDEGASLHEAFKEVMARITSRRILADGSIYWAIPYSVLLSAAGLFLLSAARHCMSALVCLFAAAISYAAALVTQLELVFGNRPDLEMCIEESCEMLGGLFILFTLGLFARSLVFQMERSNLPLAPSV